MARREVLIALLTTTGRGRGKIQDRGTQIILWVVIITSFKADEWMHRSLPIDMPGSHSWLRPAALGIVIFGMVVRAVSIFTLGRAFSANVATRTGQRLQRSGLYRLARHPSYLGLELILLGFALHTRTWACFAVVLIPPTLAVLYRTLRRRPSAWPLEPTTRTTAAPQSGSFRGFTEGRHQEKWVWEIGIAAGTASLVDPVT